MRNSLIHPCLLSLHEISQSIKTGISWNETSNCRHNSNERTEEASYFIFNKRWRRLLISSIISGGTSSLICSVKYFSMLSTSDSQNVLEIWKSWRQSTESFNPSSLIEPVFVFVVIVDEKSEWNETINWIWQKKKKKKHFCTNFGYKSDGTRFSNILTRTSSNDPI